MNYAVQNIKNTFGITMFTSPKNFIDQDEVKQRLAIESWIQQAPFVKKIVLLGSGIGYDDFARNYTGRNGVEVVVDCNIDTNFLGVPLFNSMVMRSLAAETEISVIINSDIHLSDDVVPGLDKVFRKFDNFVALAARWDVNVEEHSFLERSPAEIREFVRSNGTLHTYGGIDFWAFNTGNRSLTNTHIPPFVYGRGKYDNWLTNQIIHDGIRDVIDMSEAVTTFHLAHKYKHVQSSSVKSNAHLNYWSQNKKNSWELYVNIHLSLSYGNYKNQLGQSFHAPWKMSLCNDDSLSETNFCILKRTRPGICSCESSNFVLKTQTDPKLNAKTNKFECSSVSYEKIEEYQIPFEGIPSAVGLPHTVDTLLDSVARNNTVILTAASYAYVDMIMSFVCNLRKLKVHHFIIAALDKESYQYLYLRGVPVFYFSISEHNSQSSNHMRRDDCDYGSTCFKGITKMKTQVVLHILKKGYHVFWSDASS
jgi:hypothetical protein